MIIHADCVEAMQAMEPDSVDAVIADPPYGIGFMGKEWDGAGDGRSWATMGGPSGSDNTKHTERGGAMHAGKYDLSVTANRRFQDWCQLWATEALRVLKPGGHLLAFGGTRTYHRLACAVEDVGFEIRDNIAWQHSEPIFCRCDSVPYNHAGNGDLRGVREGDSTTAEPRGESADALLQLRVQRQGAGSGVGQARAQGGEGENARELREGSDAWGEKPSLEGRGDVLAEEGQLPGDQVRPSAGMGDTDGAQGRLHHGAPATDGADGGAPADADGSGPPPRPQPAEQRPDELGAMAVEWISQGGGAWPGCPRCGKPLAPPVFGGPLTWDFGSGFPKSLDVSKAIDKAAGVEREVVGKLGGSGYTKANVAQGAQRRETWEWDKLSGEAATSEAQHWQGWGTALKPAHEPIVVARKPLVGTVAANVLAFGTGAINVDACRIEGEPRTTHADGHRSTGSSNGYGMEAYEAEVPSGRWPPNLTLSHLPECKQTGTRCAEGCPVAELDRQSGERRSSGIYENEGTGTGEGVTYMPEKPTGAMYEDQGGASRFFPTFNQEEIPCPDDCSDDADAADAGGCDGSSPATDVGQISSSEPRFRYAAKASRAERNAGLEGFEERSGGIKNSSGRGWSARDEPYKDIQVRNHHPTVKPIALMRWLVRLVTPKGGTVLDPFTGSGSTGVAAVLEGFDFVGIEREAEYVALAEARVRFWAQFPGADVDKVLLSDAKAREIEASGQLGLL